MGWKNSDSLTLAWSRSLRRAAEYVPLQCERIATIKRESAASAHREIVPMMRSKSENRSTAGALVAARSVAAFTGMQRFVNSACVVHPAGLLKDCRHAGGCTHGRDAVGCVLREDHDTPQERHECGPSSAR